MKGFPQLKGLFPVPVTAYLTFFGEKMDTRKITKKIQDLTVGEWKNTHGLESILMLSSKF